MSRRGSLMAVRAVCSRVALAGRERWYLPARKRGAFRAVALTLMTALAATFLTGVSAEANADQVPVPHVTGPLPVTADSYPFAANAKVREPVDLKKYGYVEEEYVVDGRANVYSWNDPNGPAEVAIKDAPYANRVLVRKPSKPGRFSGVVYVELMNPAYGYDLPVIWSDSAEYIMRGGGTWVGLTTTPQTIAWLKQFDPARYGALSFANPAPTQQGCQPSDTEEGLLWDYMTQVGALLKSGSPDSPLSGYDVRYVYATGMTGGHVATYINAIGPRARLAGGAPVYDGYYIRSTGRPARISECAPRPEADDPRSISQSTEPVIRIFAQSDILDEPGGVHSSASYLFRRPDADTGHPYRHYEVAGTGLGDPAQRGRMCHVREDLNEELHAGTPCIAEELPKPAVAEYQHRYLQNAALQNLHAWVSAGVAPPHADFVAAESATGPFITDRFGHPRGGVRIPHLDVPIAYYRPEARPELFSDELLRELYGSHGGYVEQFTQHVNQMVKERWLLPRDAAELRRWAATRPVLGSNGGNG